MKSSPLNELTAQDIVRKKIKMQKIKDQMNPEHEAYRPGAQKKLAEKHHKTKYQIDTGKRGRPTSLRNEEWLAGPSRKSSSPVNNLTEGDEIVSSAEGSANYRKSALNMIGIGNITKGVKNVVDSAIDSHWKSEEDAWRKSGKGNVPSSAYAVYDRGRRTKFGPGQGKGDQGPKGAFEFDTPRLRTKYEDNPGDDKTHSYKSWKK